MSDILIDKNFEETVAKQFFAASENEIKGQMHCFLQVIKKCADIFMLLSKVLKCGRSVVDFPRVPNYESLKNLILC